MGKCAKKSRKVFFTITEDLYQDYELEADKLKVNIYDIMKMVLAKQSPTNKERKLTEDGKN